MLFRSMAERLMSTGIDFSQIQVDMLYRRNEKEMRILAIAIDNMRVYDRFALTSISQKELDEVGADQSHCRGIIDQMSFMENAEFSAFLSERGENNIKISMRSRERDLIGIAAEFNGGGHSLAAGGRLNCDLETAINLVAAAFERELVKEWQ